MLFSSGWAIDDVPLPSMGVAHRRNLGLDDATEATMPFRIGNRAPARKSGAGFFDRFDKVRRAAKLQRVRAVTPGAEAPASVLDDCVTGAQRKNGCRSRNVTVSLVALNRGHEQLADR
jgi:hypothetical protein